MSIQIDHDFAGDSDAKAEIGLAVRYLLAGATGNARSDLVREIIEIVRDVADGMSPPRRQTPPDVGAINQPPTNGIVYKAYVIDAFRRDTDRWRATVRRLNGKKIRIAVPPSMRDEATTTADALTAEKAVELAKAAIDAGELI